MGTIESEVENKTLESITFVARTDIGMRREENQDSYGVIEEERHKFYIVADGMGGVKGGALASGLAVKTVKERLNEYPVASPEIITSAVTEANTVIHERGNQEEEFTGMGTTFVGLCFVDQRMIVVNVGDSRAYRLRNDAIEQLTEDHTLVSELLRSGAITEELAANHPISHMLTRSLGPADAVEVDCWYHTEPPCCNDKYLLCSDGLYNLVKDEEIQEALINLDLDMAVKSLIDLANKRGGTDNITIIAIELGTGYPLPFSASDTLSGGEIRETVDKIMQSSEYNGKEDAQHEAPLNGHHAADETPVEAVDAEVAEVPQEEDTDAAEESLTAEAAEESGEENVEEAEQKEDLTIPGATIQTEGFAMLDPSDIPEELAAKTSKHDADSSGEFEIIVNVDEIYKSDDPVKAAEAKRKGKSKDAQKEKNAVETASDLLKTQQISQEELFGAIEEKKTPGAKETQQMSQEELFGVIEKASSVDFKDSDSAATEKEVAPEEMQGFILIGEPTESGADDESKVARLRAARRKARQQGQVHGPEDDTGFVIVDLEEEADAKVSVYKKRSPAVLMAVFGVAAIALFLVIAPFSDTMLVDSDTSGTSGVQTVALVQDPSARENPEAGVVTNNGGNGATTGDAKNIDATNDTPLELSNDEIVKTLDTASLENKRDTSEIVSESLSDEAQYLKKEIEVLEARIILLRATKTNRPDHISLLKSQQAKLPLLESRYEELELQSIEDGRQIREWLSYKSNLQENRKVGLKDAAEISIASVIQVRAPEIKDLYEQYVAAERELTEHFYTPGNRALLEAKDKERQLKERYYGLREELKKRVPEYIDNKIQSLAAQLEKTRPELEALDMQIQQLREDIEFLEALLSDNTNTKNIMRDRLQKKLQVKRQKLNNRMRLQR